MDYRRLNAVTKLDAYPLPRINDYLDALAGARYFTTLDLAAGYWQVPMESSSIEKTAFATHSGTYEFCVMPFGLANAPATFQRLMGIVLAGLPLSVCMDYIDDILVVGSTFEEHLTNLEKVLERLRGAGLRLKPAKCDLVKGQVKYLGFMVSAAGVAADPEKVRAVEKFPRPDSVKKLRSFLGLTSYYRRFIPAYARIATPLYELTKKGVPFEWTPAQEDAMSRLKRLLVEAVTLQTPDFTKPFRLETDASLEGLGAVLAQETANGIVRPLAYASHTVRGAEKNYSVTELEALGVIWAVKHFRHYLYGHRCTIVTDHQALKSILNTPQPSGKLAQWGLILQELNVEIVYRAGKKNANADALSRNPVHEPTTNDEAMELSEVNATTTYRRGPVSPQATTHIDPSVVNAAHRQGPVGHTHSEASNPSVVNAAHRQGPVGPTHDHTNPSVVNAAHRQGPVGHTQRPEAASDPLSEEQRKDKELRVIMSYLQTGELPDNAQLARRLVAERTTYEIVDNVLYKVMKDKTLRVIPPTSYRARLVEDLHGGPFGAHLGIAKTCGRVLTHYWWPGLHQYVADRCHSCAVCRGRDAGRAPKPPLNPIPVGGPFERLGIDVLQLPKSRSGKKYAIVVMDYLTKWPEVFTTSKQDTLTIAKLLMEQVVPVHGVPRELLSDRGGCFLSNLICELYRLLGIRKVNTTAYHPKTDGMVERFNRTLIEMLAKTAERDPRRWDQHVPFVLFAYRTSPHEATGETPFKLLYGREAVLPTDELLWPPQEKNEVFLDTYIDEVTTQMSEAWTLAQDHIRKAQAKQKKYHDRKARTPDFKVGDRVLVHMPVAQTAGELRKLAMPNKGYYRISEITDTGVFIIPEGKPSARPKRVAWERLRHCPEQLGQPPTETFQASSVEKEEVASEQWERRLRPRVKTLVATARTPSLGRGTCNEAMS